MITVSEAISIIEQRTRAIGHEKVALVDTVSRILAEDIVADTDLPPFDRSQMDGFAVRVDDVADAPVDLRIAGESAAGRGWHNTLQAGEAVRIMTGAPVPAGADAVQKVELTSETSFADAQAHVRTADVSVSVLESVNAGQNIVRRGAEIKKGERVFCSGELITERMIAVLAAFGYADVMVARRPRVVLLTTGSEVVEIDETPGPDQIRNSNAPMLSALVESAGGEPLNFQSVSDDLGDIKDTIRSAVAGSDIVVATGGVSVGKYDLTKAALAGLGAEIYFEKLMLKPGKPTVFARIDDTIIFGLPGNPVSAAVTFYLFVRKALLLMQSANRSDLRRARAIAGGPLKAARERDTYLPGKLEVDADGRLIVTPLKWLGSSDFIGFAAADALAHVPAGSVVRPGETADILFL